MSPNVIQNVVQQEQEHIFSFGMTGDVLNDGLDDIELNRIYIFRHKYNCLSRTKNTVT